MSLTSSGKQLNLIKNKKLNSCNIIAATAARLTVIKVKIYFNNKACKTYQLSLKTKHHHQSIITHLLGHAHSNLLFT